MDEHYSDGTCSIDKCSCNGFEFLRISDLECKKFNDIHNVIDKSNY